MKKIVTLLTASFLFFVSCNDTAQIGENTFVYDKKVYRIIDNQITELGDLNNDLISKSDVLNPTLRDFGKNEMSFVADGVYTELTAVYRGDILYYKLELHGLNDLRTKYRAGGFTINFVDEYNFRIHNTYVEIGDMTRIIGSKGETLNFEYNGKSQMSSEVYSAIYTYSVSAALQEMGRYSW